MWSTFWEVPEETGSVSIGEPLANTDVYVLDSMGRPVADGVSGELFIGGDGLARGYMGRAGLTAERFVPDPFGPAGARLYRTGDLVRRLADGSLEYQGRIDTQVKVRGYRIELGEIETVLRAHQSVKDAVVSAREDGAGDKTLVAYVVPDAALDVAGLRAHLGASLPDYMVPAAFVAIDRVPLTNSGKVDHRALPAPEQDMFSTRHYVSPRTPLEERLAAVWSDVLGVEQVSIEDSFFDLGGDSIRAVRLVGGLRAAGYEVSVREVFEHRTITALAGQLSGQVAGESLIDPIAPFALISDEDWAAMPDDVVDAYPLSQVQTGMLVEMMATRDRGEGQVVYHNVNSFRIPDAQPFSEKALRAALDLAANRHQALRTSMHLSGYSQPLQLVHAAVELPLAVSDLRELGTDEQRELLRALADEECASAVELTNPCLMRVVVHLESDDAWRLTFSYNHAIAEGWTINSLLMEVVECYQHLRDGRELPVYEAPAVRYADFIAAETESLASETDRSFWRDVVDEHAPLRIPATWSGAAEASSERHGVEVPFADLEEGLRGLALKANTSLKSVLLAAHLKVMSALTNEDAFHTGVVFHGRLEAPGADRVVGMHLNTVPFPGTRPTGSWRELVEQVYAQEAEIWAHRRYPLPAIQREAASGERLLSVMFEHQNFHQADSATAGAGSDGQAGGTDFALSVVAANGTIGLATSTDVIERADLGRLASMYRSVLEAMAADFDGDASVACLPEGARVGLAGEVVEWPGGSALEMFESQAASSPELVAVVSGDEQLSYGELEGRSNQLARHLLGLGVGAGSVVGVCLERSPAVLVAMLASWKVGAAYVPVDPALPAERRDYMLVDAGASVLVTESDVAEFDGHRVLLDAEREVISEQPATPLDVRVDRDGLAYVLYTSGSTGRPKGVMISHQGLHNMLSSIRDVTGSGSDGVWLASTSISFDISGLELFLPLIAGGRVVMASSGQARDAEALLELISKNRVTHVQLTPSGWRLMLAAGFGDSGVTALVGGEACSLELANELRARTRRLVNVYGPTETTIWSTFWEIPEKTESVSIGEPFANTELFILDSIGRPVADGVSGELFICGMGLARGYMGRAGLTAERFVPNPFGPAGARLYRTGDLVRRLPDGSLDYQGRIDTQVKVRGYRIELGEIETVLRAHQSVKDAVVSAREDGAGDKTLVAYVVADDPLDTAELRRHLGASLPDYMVPAAFVAIDRVPLTNSGKVDHRALPAPEQDMFPARHYVEPRTPLEQRLAAIWSDVLGLERVSVEDSFFDVGGDSIRAVRVLSAAQEAGIPLSVWMILQAKSLAELAHMIDADADPFPAQDGMPLLPGHLKRLEADSSAGRTVRLPLNLSADAGTLDRALREVVRHHEALRLRFPVRGEEDGHARLAEVSEETLVRVLDLSATTADDRVTAIAEAMDRASAGLAPERGALVQATLVRFEDGNPGELWLTVHDLALDDRSWSIVLGDLNTAYRQCSAGEPVSLAAVATPLHSWARALAEQAHSDEMLDQAGVWLNRPSPTPLPVDHPREHNTYATGNTVTATLPADLTRVLLDDAHPEHLLLGTLARTLARWTGAERVDVDVIVDPRRDGDREPSESLARTVGPLTDSYPVSLRLSGNGDAAAALKSVARQLRTLPEPRYGYGLLRHLAPDADVAEELATLPAAEVGFTFTPLEERDVDSALAFVPDRVAPAPAADAVRAHLLDVEAYVLGDQLYLQWTHSTAVHDQQTVQRLVGEQLGELTDLLRQGAGTVGKRSRRRVAEDPFGAAVDEVQSVMARNEIPGVSLALIQDGKTALVRSFGVVGGGSSEPVTPETVFAAGSISKHVTTFTVLRLVSEGRLDLDRDFNDYLSSWRIPSDPDHPVTARMLLSNLGGFAQRPALADGYHRYDPVPTLLDVLNGRPPAKTPAVEMGDVPGKVFQKGLAGFSVLQQAMADITGETYPELTRRLVFDPLAMTDSSFDPRFPDAAGRPFARGHDEAGKLMSDGYYINPEAAAGGLWTTAADLANLSAAVRRCYLGSEDGLVDPGLVRQMLTPQSDRAYGWSTIIDTTSGEVEFGHGGQAAGYQAMTWMRAHSGLGLVMLSNSVSGRELVKHLIATVLSGRTRMAGVWQRAIDEAVQREQGNAAESGRS
ncbi:amino acid adenylation domain-containing protein [Streptomyces olivoverticillatus]|uniref:amino acid adenylation domain-containing protein n=1 Tax=Streptomyces olivoverticillatus TaxID=66427 RepID=UPI0031B59A8A